MSLIPDCLYLTPFDQDRQYRKTRTSLIPAEGRGPFLLSCLIWTVLRKSYLSSRIDVADGNERISAARIGGLRMLIRADMHARPPRRPADVASNERVATTKTGRREAYTLPNERIRWSGQSGRQGAGAAEAPAQAAGKAGRSFSLAQRATVDPPGS
jgi:hypothetical protein